MDSRQLKQFLALSETLHFGRAATLCHVSASALSRNIQQLERTLGVALFVRDNRSVALTHAGEQFLNYARDTIVRWDEIRNTLLATAGELHGEVSIYCSVTASYSFLFELLHEFRKENPRVEIKLHTGDPEDAMNHVLAGNEDIAIGARPERMSAELAFRPIQITPLVFIAAKAQQSLAKTLRTNDHEAWTSTPMILSERGLARARIDQWFSDLGVQPQVYAQVAGNEAIVSMVSLGLGVGVVPEIVLQNSPLAGQVRVLPITPELESYEVGLFTQQKNLKNPLIQAFWSQREGASR